MPLQTGQETREHALCVLAFMMMNRHGKEVVKGVRRTGGGGPLLTGRRMDLRSLWLADPSQLAPGAPRAAATPDAVIVDVAGCRTPGSAGSLAPLLAGARMGATCRVLVWLSPLASGRTDAELDAILPAQPDGVVLPGCTDGRDLQHCGVKLGVREAQAGWAAGSIALVAVPSAAGLLALGSFRGASPRLQALAFEPPAPPGEPAAAALHRTLLVLGALGAGVPALDAAPWDLAAGFDDCCRQARRLGFGGKVTRDPSRIAAIADAFADAAPVRGGVSADG